MYPLRPLPPIEGSGREPVRRLKTVSHVLEFFEQTPRPPFKFVYCNKSTDSLRFRPYDLHVVLRGEQQSEHWVVTKQGIVHVVPFEAPELFRVDQWVKEATQFDKLTQLKLFKNYLSHKAFSRWKNNVRYGLFLQARTRCAKRLFLSKHTFAQPLFELHKLSFDLQTPALLAYPTQEVQITRAPGESLGLQFSSSMMLTGVSQGPAQRAPVERLLAQKDWRLTHINHQPIADHAAYQAFCSGPATLLFLRFAQKVHYDLKDFRDRQAEQRDVAEAQYAATTNAIRDQVAALCQRLIHAAHVPDFVTPEKLDEYLSAHSMVPGNKGMLYKSERDAEKQERKRALKKVMIECDFIGNFLRLVDSMVVESVFKAALSQSKAFLLHEQQPEKSKDLLVTFELTCQFDPQRFLMLVPTHANLQDAFKQLLAGVVKEAESVPRLPKTLGEQYKDKILHQPPDLISIESLLLADTRYQFIVQELEQVVTSSFERAQSASTDYKGCRNCKHFIDDEWKAEAKRWQLERDHLTAADFVRYIKRVKATFKADLEKMHDGDHGILHTSIKKLTSELIGPLELILDQIKTSLLDLATKRAQEITRQAYEREGTQSLETMKHRLEEKRITPLKYFAEWVRDCNGMYEKQPKVNQEVDAIEELFRVADQAGFNIPYVQLGTRNDMIDERDKYNQVVDTSKERRKKEMPAMLVQLKEALDDENKKLSAITKELTDPKSDYKNPKSPAQFILEVKLSALSQQLKAIKQWTGALNEWQVLFEQPVPPPCPALVQAEKYFDEKFDLWNSLARWEEKKRIWGTTPLDKLDIVDVKQQIEELFAKSYKMNKQDGDGVTEKLLSLVSAEKQHLPVMEALGNKALRDRHWERIFEAMNKASPPERTLDSMRAMGAFSHVAKVQEISSVATGEFGVQRDLDVVKNLWLDPADGLEFIIKNHREQADVFILGGLEEVIEKLEDNQVTIQTCLASRWAQGIRSDIEEWEEKLRITAETLDEWINLQKTWIAMVSSEGEIVPFTIPVNATGNVEHWLGEIERNMRKTLTDCMRSCVEACPQSVREEWYFQFPAQCVSCVDVIYWTAELEEVWDKMSNKGQPAALREYYAQYQQQILRTVELVKTDLNNLKLKIKEVVNDSLIKAIEQVLPFYLDGGWLPLARSFSETIVKTANFGPRWMHGRLMDLLQQVVPDTLTFLRKDCSEYIATIDSQLVMSLCKLMQAYVANWDEQDDGDDAEAEAESAGGEKVDIGLSRPAKPEKKPVNEKSLFDKFFIMSYIWSLGGNVADASRQKFDAFMQQVITKTFPEAKFPTTGSCFNYIVHKAGNVFLPWAYKVPTFRYHRDKEFFEMLVQTPDTAILRQHITYLFSVNRHVLVNGVTGVGKSAAVSYVLTDVMQSENPSAPWQSCGMSFSAQTSSVNLQEFVEVNLTKKKNSLLGAAPGKRCIILVDDANMPEPEKYGASPPLELLRQLLQRGGSPLGDSEGGLFDRKRKDLYKDIRDVVCIACCGPPGGGKHEMTQRLTTHFHCLVVPQLSADSMISIFTSILAGFLSSFSDEVSKLAKQVVSGTIEVFQRISVEMLPTPLKIHYTFNLRDLSKVVQGILMMEPKHLSTSDQLAKVFCHEASRVFHDRLICEEDREWWWTTIGEVCKKYLNAKVDNSWRKLLFGGWADPKDDSYKEISANPGLQDLLNDYQVDFSVQKSKESDLVMFDDAIQHLTRMCRMLRQPRGNALLVGVGGSGRHSITELAAFICQQRCFQIAVSRGYDIPQFRDDLKNLLLEAGCKAKPVVFLFSDTQIVREQFLEDINNVLNVGDVPNIYLTEDYEKIINATRERCTSDNRRSIIRRYVQLVRDNLHVIFCVSPIGDNFRARLRMFPSLVNCMTIDWYTKWPAEALKQVAHRVFGKASGVSAETVKENLVKLAEMCVTMHVAIEEQSENMWNTLKRRNYTTPTSYLSLLASYLNMLEESMSDTDSKLGRFQSGLDKLASTSSMVEKLKKELQDMQPQLEKASQEAEVQGKEIAKGKDEASKVKAVVEVEEARCKKIMTEAEEIRSDCQAGLDKAMPVFFQAQEALKTLEKKDIDQIKSYAKPPEPVEKTMNAVILLLGASKLDWSTAKQFMADTRFFKKLEDFDKDNIDAKVVKKLQVFIKDAGFTPEIIGQSSNPCKSMCMWCRAIDNYYWVTKDLGPKKEALKGAEAKLQAAKAELDEKQQELNVCNNKVAKLEKDAEETIRRKDNLEHQKQQAVAKLERADQLLGGLAGEAGRWKESVASLEESKGMLVGTMLLASGCVAYVGPFPSKYRKDIVTQWTQKCQSLKIPVKEGFTLDTITDQVTTRAWSQYGLPLDPFSVENGTILSRSQRWCLMIDPQGQANNFIKKKEKENQLKVLKLTQDKFMQQLEQNIRIGRPVLIENIGEELDAALDPVLLKQTFKTGGRVVIKLGDTEVDYDENFKLFLTTKLPNPLYSPELQIKVAIVNFTVTTKGLEDQLLNDVVQVERADLAENKDKVVVQIADGQRTLKNIQDRILKMLAEATGDILDNVELIQTLADSKVTSSEVTNALADAEVMSAEISLAAEKYRPVATRGSLLYATIADIANIDHMYQYSLTFYKSLFVATIQKTAAPQETGVDARVKDLVPVITQATYNAICRGLFEKDKIIFSFTMAYHIFKDAGAITEDEWSLFLRGSAGGQKIPPKPSHVEWTTSWEACCALSTLPGLEFLPEEVANTPGWAEWMKDPNPHEAEYPGTASGISEWRKLLILKALRSEKCLFGIPKLVRHMMGPSYTESPPFRLAEAFDDSNSVTPLIFVLSTGTDPTVIFTSFAKSQGHDPTKLQMLSLGQDQGPKAQAMIERGRNEGEWVYLQNCHVYTSWMPTLERIMEDLAQKASAGQVHPNFRLWLTSNPSTAFPVSVLQMGLKLTREPPKGLRANLKDSFNAINDELWAEQDEKKQLEWKKLIFSLVFFHGLVQERRKFGALGWNIAYEWSGPDLTASVKTIRLCLSDFDDIPWPAVRYTIGVINYGGRVTDFLDNRLLQTFIGKYFVETTFGDDFAYDDKGEYRPPPGDASREGVMDMLENLPLYEDPTLYGLPTNASITFQAKESSAMMDTIINVQPKAGGGGGSGTTDSVVWSIAEDFIARCPALVDKSKAHADVFRITEAGTMISLGTVLSQEIDQFNSLLKALMSSMKELKRAIKGEVVLSASLEQMYNSFVFGRVPPNWEKKAYLCLKPLQPWYTDMIERIEFLTDWCYNGMPTLYWLPGMFFPQGFLTGILQTHSREHTIPIDELKHGVSVRGETDRRQPADRPKDGCLIIGFYLEGARWDLEKNQLAESVPGQLFSELPSLWLLPHKKTDPDPPNTYQCPLYKALTRSGTLSTTGLSTNYIMNFDLPLAPDSTKEHWILRGTASFCMLNT
eukprot:gene4074-6331_t